MDVNDSALLGQEAAPLPKPLIKQDLTQNAPVTYHILLALCKPTLRHAVKNRPASSTHKKVVVVLTDRSSTPGYLNPARLQPGQPIDLLTADGEHRSIDMNGCPSRLLCS